MGEGPLLPPPPPRRSALILLLCSLCNWKSRRDPFTARVSLSFPRFGALGLASPAGVGVRERAVMGSQGRLPPNPPDTGAGEGRLVSPSHLCWFWASSPFRSPAEREEMVAGELLPAALLRSRTLVDQREGCWSSFCQSLLGQVGTVTAANRPLPSAGQGPP